MLTMPRWKLKTMRWLSLGMLAVIRRWEDKHARPENYRMTEATTGLWQASQAFRAVLDGDSGPVRPLARKADVPDLGGNVLGEKYVAELIDNASIPLRLAVEI